MLLSVRNLEVCYGVISALQDVSVDVGRGEIVTLIGANGAGKTTLLRAISGLLRPQRGTVLWDPGAAPSAVAHGKAPIDAHASAAATNGETATNRDATPRVIDYRSPTVTGIERLRPHEIVRLGICHVPEGRQIFAHLSVRENLMLGAYQRRDADGVRADLERCYGLFPVLSERQRQKAGTLSGGEQQMLAIGRAMMARPQLLLLDEPSLGLAPLLVEEVFRVIGEIGDEGTPILLVEQNARMALRLADRGYVLENGRVVRQGTGTELLHDDAVIAAYLGGA